MIKSCCLERGRKYAFCVAKAAFMKIDRVCMSAQYFRHPDLRTKSQAKG